MAEPAPDAVFFEMLQLLIKVFTVLVLLADEGSDPRNRIAPPLANAALKLPPPETIIISGLVFAKLSLKEERLMTEVNLRTNKAPPPMYPSHFLCKRRELKDSESKRQLDLKKFEPTMLRERVPGFQVCSALLVVIGAAETNL